MEPYPRANDVEKITMIWASEKGFDHAAQKIKIWGAEEMGKRGRVLNDAVLAKHMHSLKTNMRKILTENYGKVTSDGATIRPTSWCIYHLMPGAKEPSYLDMMSPKPKYKAIRADILEKRAILHTKVRVVEELGGHKRIVYGAGRNKCKRI